MPGRECVASAVASHPVTTATLASGYALTGCGAYVNWAGQGNLPWKIKPQGPGACGVASKDHINSDPASIYGYAIGLRGF